VAHLQHKRLLKWIAVLSTLSMLEVLVGGALVTKTESGLGCGRNWPDCNGSLIPQEITPEVLIEFSHRISTGIACILVGALVWLTWRKLDHVREVKFLGIISILFIVIQALVGAAQVLWGQGDFILALHFGISLISFTAVMLLALIVFEVDQKFDAERVHIDKTMKWHIIGVTIYSYMVIYTGALVRHTDSSLVCPDWPLCRNDSPFELPNNMYEWIQMGHRLAVLFIVIWIILIAIHTTKFYKDQAVIYKGWLLAVGLVTLQVLAGMSVVLTKLNLFVSLAHTTIIAVLFSFFCYMIMMIYRSNLNEQ
jgi:heme a synthase